MATFYFTHESSAVKIYYSQHDVQMQNFVLQTACPAALQYREGIFCWYFWFELWDKEKHCNLKTYQKDFLFVWM